MDIAAGGQVSYKENPFSSAFTVLQSPTRYETWNILYTDEAEQDYPAVRAKGHHYFPYLGSDFKFSVATSKSTEFGTPRNN